MRQEFYDPSLDMRVRLQTFVNLRWLAVAGQVVTLIFASFILQLRIDFGLCLLAVGTSVIANLTTMTIFPPTVRLGDKAAMAVLLFDILQLSFLLFLTGGLNNPFALLIAVPVTVSATVLSLQATILLASSTSGLIVTLAFFHLPLRSQEGFILEMPALHLAGFGVSIIVGTLFMSAYAYRLSQERNSMSLALFATQSALAREQKLTDLGGVVAAYAHEMGTPLATITLVAGELADELEDPIQKEDIQLIREQADRCRDILRSMGNIGKDDKHMRTAPLPTVLEEAAEPHKDRGIQIKYSYNGSPEVALPPHLIRKPEFIHGLRNTIQNAVDFASGTIWIDSSWSSEMLKIRIIDDGPGYPPDLIHKIGDPFLRSKKDGAQRKNYEGMGLGLFIAKTLLERTGAQVTFANGNDPFLNPNETPERSGAIVELYWPTPDLLIREGLLSEGLGENQPFRV